MIAVYNYTVRIQADTWIDHTGAVIYENIPILSLSLARCKRYPAKGCNNQVQYELFSIWHSALHGQTLSAQLRQHARAEKSHAWNI